MSDSTEFITTFENRWSAMYGTSHLDSFKACAVIFYEEYNQEWPDAFGKLGKWIEANDEVLELTKPTDG